MNSSYVIRLCCELSLFPGRGYAFTRYHARATGWVSNSVAALYSHARSYVAANRVLRNGLPPAFACTTIWCMDQHLYISHLHAARYATFFSYTVFSMSLCRMNEARQGLGIVPQVLNLRHSCCSVCVLYFNALGNVIQYVYAV